jgi:hypothetical protein
MSFAGVMSTLFHLQNPLKFATLFFIFPRQAPARLDEANTIRPQTKVILYLNTPSVKRYIPPFQSTTDNSVPNQPDAMFMKKLKCIMNHYNLQQSRARAAAAAAAAAAVANVTYQCHESWASYASFVLVSKFWLDGVLLSVTGTASAPEHSLSCLPRRFIVARQAIARARFSAMEEERPSSQETYTYSKVLVSAEVQLFTLPEDLRIYVDFSHCFQNP